MNPFARWAQRLHGAPLQADALPPGLVLGGVTLTQRIGRGSSAVVYAGVDAGSRMPCALKVWCPRSVAGASDADARAFLAEAERVRPLDHPGIVRVLRSGTQQGLSWIVSELFSGGSLARHASTDQRLPLVRVMDITLQLAAGLAHAHRQGLVHRDVKPSNALFDAATGRAALCDFGIARAHDAQASRSGVMMGSPVYMAPEQLAGQRADAGSDLYALAVLSFELLAGRPPFEAASMGALLRAVAQAPPPPLAALRPDWPAPVAARLDAWFAAVLAKDPARRPADGAAWAAQAGAVIAWVETQSGAAYNTNLL